VFQFRGKGLIKPGPVRGRGVQAWLGDLPFLFLGKLIVLSGMYGQKKTAVVERNKGQRKKPTVKGFDLPDG